MVAAARVRQEPHSNRPLAMTQQHAVRPRDHWGTAGRRSGEAEPGGWKDQGGRREAGGKSGEAGARETAAAARGRAARAAPWARACALQGAAPRPPATWAWPHLSPAWPQVEWEPGVPAVEFSKMCLTPFSKRWVNTCRGSFLVVSKELREALDPVY